MKVLVIKNNQIINYDLPSKIFGNYWIKDIDSTGNERRLINVEETDGKWKIKSNHSCKIVYNNAYQEAVYLADYSYCELEVEGEVEHFTLYCCPVYEKSYKLYAIKGTRVLLIGNDSSNHIIYKSNDISRQQLKLTSNNVFWNVQNIQPNRKVYVNNVAVNSQNLVYGDILFLMGLKIILLNNYILINNPNNLVEVNPQNLEYIDMIEVEENPEEDNDLLELFSKSDYYYRSPRFRNNIVKDTVVMDPPPAPQNQGQMPFLLAMGSMLVMGVRSVMGLMSIVDQVSMKQITWAEATPSLVTNGSMIVGSLMIPLLTRVYQKRMAKKYERKRQKKYTDYLQMQRNVIGNIIKKQTEVLLTNYPSLDECYNIIVNRKRNLWERKIDNDDFLTLRVGLGNIPIDMDLQCQEKHFTLDEDNLVDDMYRVKEEFQLLKDVPITISLTEKYISAILGNTNVISNFLESLIIQMITYHSYEDLKIVILTNEKNAGRYEYLKVLPHCWSNDKSIRFFGTNNDDINKISMYLMNEFKSRKYQDEEDTNTSKEEDYKSYAPYYIVITDNFVSSRKVEIIRNILGQDINYGFSLLILANRLNELPNECSTFLNIDVNVSGMIENDLTSDSQKAFKADFNRSVNIYECSTRLANIPIELSGGSYDLPNMLSFLEMYDVGNVDQLNSMERWKTNNPVGSLQVPVGINENGELFKLDLHEKAHGPHGLVAGTTGSGKSEFIITYILSLAVNYHPYEVSFVLIDYKGGGLAGAFENKDTGVKLPHLAGTITNLDVTEINRSLASIESELKRRQRIFNEARDKLEESTIDIYKYQKYYREGLVDEPVSHLFIISDEFAELKSQQPEFMAQLISTARIGRSLGVHLILATQKPSGVVDDQIWSNSKFRVCLKVQDKSDSNDMIKCPDAAKLSNAGRFYLQVGYNEFFALGQSAWCGAPYYPSDERKKTIDANLNFLDTVGEVVKSADRQRGINAVKADGEELPHIVKYLTKIAKAENIKIKPLWIDRIPDIIYVDQLRTKYNYQPVRFKINPIIGEYDDPHSQSQGLLTLPISEEGNTIVYGVTGSGKDLFINSIIYSTITTHTPEEVNFYLLDFGSETLRMFKNIPHVGDVLFSSDADKIDNLFKMIRDECEIRKNLFADYNGSFDYYNANSGKTIPAMIIIISAFEAFSELFPDYNDVLVTLTREATRYGIYFILSTSGINSIRYKLSANFPQSIALQLNDKSDYTSILGNTGGVLPSKIYGRGVCKLDNYYYEFQTAHMYDANKTLEFVNSLTKKLNEIYTVKARKIPILPEQVKIGDVISKVKDFDDVPVGIRKDDLVIETYDFANKFVTNIAAQDLDAFVPFVPSLINIFQSKYDTDISILDAGKMFTKNKFNCDHITSGFNDYFDGLEAKINKIYTEAESNGFSEQFLNTIKRKVIMITAIQDFSVNMGKEFGDRYNTFLDKCKKLNRVNVIYVDTIDNLKKLDFENWYKSFNESNRAIWIGNGLGGQFTIKLNKNPRYLNDQISNDFGYTITNGNVSTLVKLLNDEPDGNVDSLE